MAPKKIGEYKLKARHQLARGAKRVVGRQPNSFNLHVWCMQNILDAYKTESEALSKIHVTVVNQLHRLQVGRGERSGAHPYDPLLSMLWLPPLVWLAKGPLGTGGFIAGPSWSRCAWMPLSLMASTKRYQGDRR